MREHQHRLHEHGPKQGAPEACRLVATEWGRSQSGGRGKYLVGRHSDQVLPHPCQLVRAQKAPHLLRGGVDRHRSID
jgi:hypothetical protein